MISFKKALNNVQGFTICPNTKTENKGYLYEGRIDRTTVPTGWYLYDIRGSDYDPNRPTTIEDKPVLVNFVGHFITKMPVKFTRTDYSGTKYRRLSGRGGWTFDKMEEPPRV